MNAFQKGDPSDIRKGRRIAEQIFGEGWEEKGAGVYEEGETKAQVVGMGNCHVGSPLFIFNMMAVLTDL